MVRYRLGKLGIHRPREEGGAPSWSRYSRGADLQRTEAPSRAGIPRTAAGAIYVVPMARGGRNLGTQAKRLVAKAGVEVWPKMFVNLRGSRSDDLDRNPEITDKAIDVWIGNSEKIRRRHYHGLRPEGLGGGHRKSGANSGAPSVVQECSGAVSPSRIPRKIARRREGRGKSVPPAGIEQPRFERDLPAAACSACHADFGRAASGAAASGAAPAVLRHAWGSKTVMP